MPRHLILLMSIVLIAATMFGCSGNGGSATSPPGAGSGGSAPAQTSGAPSDASNVPQRSKTFTAAFSEDCTTLDPQNITNQGSEVTIKMCYETLLYSDHEGNYTPMLAESWEIDPSGMFWTFKLREGVTFNNGEPFDADDVVCSFQRMVDRGGELGYAMSYWKSLESVEKIDQYHVKINFKEPFANAINSFRGAYIIPNEAYEQYGDDLFNLHYLYGTGPWILEEWIDSQYARYSKNENYWNKAEYDSYFDEVIIRYVKEPSSAVAAQLSGDIDAYCASGGMNMDMLPMYGGTENKIEIMQIQTNFDMYLHMNFKEGSVFNDKNVRLALECAIDRAAIVDNILRGGTVPIAIFPEGVIGYDATIPPYVYDPAQAKAYLEASGYDGRQIELMGNTSMPKAEDCCLAIADMLNAVGFNMTVRVEDSATFNTRRSTGDYDIFAIHSMFPDGTAFNHMNTRIMNDNHKSSYVNEEMFALIREYNTNMDKNAREEIAKKVNRMIREDAAPQSCYAVLEATYAINYGVKGINLYPDGQVNFSYVDYDPSLIP